MIITARLCEGRYRTRLTIRFVLWLTSYIMWFCFLLLILILPWFDPIRCGSSPLPVQYCKVTKIARVIAEFFLLTGSDRPFIVCCVGESGRIWRANTP